MKMGGGLLKANQEEKMASCFTKIRGKTTKVINLCFSWVILTSIHGQNTPVPCDVLSLGIVKC